jgi:hypothetical protein
MHQSRFRTPILLRHDRQPCVVQADVRTRLASFGCKMSKQAVAKMMHEVLPAAVLAKMA